jgi:hypothetical protein
MGEGVGSPGSPQKRSSSVASEGADCGSFTKLAQMPGITLYERCPGPRSLGPCARTKIDYFLSRSRSSATAVIGDEAI